MIRVLWRILFYNTVLLGLTLAKCKLPEDEKSECQLDKIKFNGTEIVPLSAGDFNTCALYCMWSEKKCNGISFRSSESEGGEGSCMLFSEVTDCERNQLNWKSSYKFYSSQSADVPRNWNSPVDHLAGANLEDGLTRLNETLKDTNGVWSEKEKIFRCFFNESIGVDITWSFHGVHVRSEVVEGDGVDIMEGNQVLMLSPEKIDELQSKGVKGVTCSAGTRESLNISFPPANFIKKTFMLNLDPDMNQLTNILLRSSDDQTLYQEDAIIRDDEKEKYMFASRNLSYNGRIEDIHLDFLAVRGENCKEYKILNCTFKNDALGETITCDGTGIKAHCKLKSLSKTTYWINDTKSVCRLKMISNLNTSINVLQGGLVNLTLNVENERCLLYSQLLLQELKNNQSHYGNDDRLNATMFILTQMSSSMNVSFNFRNSATDLILTFMKNDALKDGIKTIHGKKVTVVLWEVSLGEEKTLDFPMAEDVECWDKDNRAAKKAGYKGTQSVTKEGYTCQKWTEQSPQSHNYTAAKYADKGVGDHNYCRNPAEEYNKTWCFTTDPSKRQDWCVVPICPETEITLTLPIGFKTALGGPQSVTVFLTQYHDPATDFNSKLEDKRYVSKLVDIVIVDHPKLSGLKKDEEISIRIRLNEKNTFSLYYHPRCYWYDNKTQSWTTNGVTTTFIKDGYTLECNTTHLTPFSILMNPGPKLDDPHDMILSVLTYICGGLSCLALVFTLIALISFKDIRRAPSNQIHIGLATTMLVAMLLFLGGAKPYKDMNEHLCKVIAIGIHYTWLTVFAWTVVESYNLWLLFIRIFQARSSRFIWKSTITVLVIPGLFVGLTAGISYDDYADEMVCLLRNNALFFFFTPIAGLSIIVNTDIFILVMYEICNKVKYQSNLQKLKSQLRAVFTLSCVLGLFWVLGFLVYETQHIVFHYLFTVCNTLQGVLIFIFHCVIKPDVYQKWRDLFCNIGKKSTRRPGSRYRNISTPTALNIWKNFRYKSPTKSRLDFFIRMFQKRSSVVTPSTTVNELSLTNQLTRQRTDSKDSLTAGMQTAVALMNKSALEPLERKDSSFANPSLEHVREVQRKMLSSRSSLGDQSGHDLTPPGVSNPEFLEAQETNTNSPKNSITLPKSFNFVNVQTKIRDAMASYASGKRSASPLDLIRGRGKITPTPPPQIEVVKIKRKQTLKQTPKAEIDKLSTLTNDARSTPKTSPKIKPQTPITSKLSQLEEWILEEH